MKDWVKIKNISAVFFLGFFLWTSLSISVYGRVIAKDLTAYPGQTIERRMSFTNEGKVTTYDVYATPTGDAADWPSHKC